MTDLSKLTNKRLAKMLEAQYQKDRETVLAVFALAEHPNETFSEIMARLGN